MTKNEKLKKLLKFGQIKIRISPKTSKMTKTEHEIKNLIQIS